MSTDTLAERIRERAREFIESNCEKHPFGKLPEGKGLWQVSHSGCDYPDGGCNCYCGINCNGQWTSEKVVAFALSKLSAAEKAARKEEREQCCKDVCSDCRCGLPLTTDGDLNERHYILHQNGITKILTSHCAAAAIRNRTKG